MEKSKVFERLGSLSKDQKIRLFDSISRYLEDQDLDLHFPDPLYECEVWYGTRKDRWDGYVDSVQLCSDSLVIHFSPDPCSIDYSLANLASALFQYVCERESVLFGTFIRLSSQEVPE